MAWVFHRRAGSPLSSQTASSLLLTLCVSVCLYRRIMSLVTTVDRTAFLLSLRMLAHDDPFTVFRTKISLWSFLKSSDRETNK